MRMLLHQSLMLRQEPLVSRRARQRARSVRAGSSRAVASVHHLSPIDWLRPFPLSVCADLVDAAFHDVTSRCGRDVAVKALGGVPGHDGHTPCAEAIGRQLNSESSFVVFLVLAVAVGVQDELSLFRARDEAAMSRLRRIFHVERVVWAASTWNASSPSSAVVAVVVVVVIGGLARGGRIEEGGESVHAIAEAVHEDAGLIEDGRKQVVGLVLVAACVIRPTFAARSTRAGRPHSWNSAFSMSVGRKIPGRW